MHKYLNALLTLTVMLAPTAATAHVVPGDPHGSLAHGFLHPLGGVDHALAMIAVGILAYQIGGRALWLLPTIFVAVMVVGWGLGLAGATLPYVEVGIAASVIVLGIAILVRIKTPLALSATLTAVFALFHGYAHGAEMPAAHAPELYAAGFLAATALLHVAGLGLGIALGRLGSTSGTALRAAGLAIAVIGAAILIQAV